MRVLIPDSVVYREHHDAIVAMSLRSGEYATLGDVARRIWAGIAAGTSLDDITDQLVAEYDVPPATCRGELDTLVTRLLEMHLLERADLRP